MTLCYIKTLHIMNRLWTLIAKVWKVLANSMFRRPVLYHVPLQSDPAPVSISLYRYPSVLTNESTTSEAFPSLSAYRYARQETKQITYFKPVVPGKLEVTDTVLARR